MSLFELITGHQRLEIVSLKSILYQTIQNWKSYIKWVIGGITVGLIICFSIPKEYSAKIILVRENNKSDRIIDVNNELLTTFLTSSTSRDAYNEYLYSPLLKSSSFLYSLLDVPILFLDNKETTSVKEILKSEKSPWWNLSFLSNTYNISRNINTIATENSQLRYSEEDTKLIETLRQRIFLSKIETTGALQLEVRMQHPIAAALLADTIRERFENYLNQYRHQKARLKLADATEQEQKARLKWYVLQDSLGRYEDTHNSVWSSQGNIIPQRLRNDVQLAYEGYTSSVQTKQLAETELYKTMPIFAIVSPSKVPLKPSNPKKLVIISYCFFISVFIPIIKVIFTKTQKNL
ncbi:hypothetical protein HDR69_05195 [bacterium]|nr:hypothetical protein [bacterium]